MGGKSSSLLLSCLFDEFVSLVASIPWEDEWI